MERPDQFKFSTFRSDIVRGLLLAFEEARVDVYEKLKHKHTQLTQSTRRHRSLIASIDGDSFQSQLEQLINKVFSLYLSVFTGAYGTVRGCGPSQAL